MRSRKQTPRPSPAIFAVAALLLARGALQGELAAHYRLDEAEGTGNPVADSAGSNDASLINSGLVGRESVPSPFRAAYDFGNGGGVDLGISAAVRPETDWTITWWTRLDKLDAFDRLVESMNGTVTTSRGLRFDLGSAPGNHIRMLLRDGTGAQLALQHVRVLDTGTWYFVAARFDSGNVATGRVTVISEHDPLGSTVVADNTRTATNATLGPVQYAAPRSTVLAVENTNGLPQNALDGRLDDVAFYDTVLGDNEIKFVRRFGAQTRLPAIAWDAADAGNTPLAAWRQNLGTNRQWNLTGGTNAPAFSSVTSAYRITNALAFAGTGEAAISAGLPGRRQDVSVEVWFKPRDLGAGDREVLFEAGGDANGFSLLLEGPVLNLRYDQDDVADLAGSNHLEAAHTLRHVDIADFVQAVAVVDLATNAIRLFVNGQEVASAAPPSAGTGAGDMTAWAGGNTEHIGSLRPADTNGVGGDDGTDLDAYAVFDGQIAAVRFYQDTVLDPAQVQANYEAMAAAVPLPSTVWILLAGVTVLFVTGRRP